jgi:very-short-patch-repair endonuclease
VGIGSIGVAGDRLARRPVCRRISVSAPLRIQRSSKARGDAVDRRIGDLASRQYGVVSRAQLVGLGLTRGAILTRMRHGWLRPVHRGVYAVGHSRLEHRGTWMAAVLAGGGAGRAMATPPTAAVLAGGDPGPTVLAAATRSGRTQDAVTVALSHRSAAALHGLGPARRGDIVEITTDTPRSSRDRLRVHRTGSLAGSTTVRDGIACTTVARTLVDLAAIESTAATERRWSTAASRNLIRSTDIRHELRTRPQHPGVVVIRAAFARDFAVLGQRTRSDLERMALRLCRDFELPPPHANRLVEVDGVVYEADLLWPEQRLIVEVDGDRTHGHPAARRVDRRRDATLQLAGWRTIRIGESELESEPQETARRLRAALDQPPLIPADGSSGPTTSLP